MDLTTMAACGSRKWHPCAFIYQQFRNYIPGNRHQKPRSFYSIPGLCHLWVLKHGLLGFQWWLPLAKITFRTWDPCGPTGETLLVSTLWRQTCSQEWDHQGGHGRGNGQNDWHCQGSKGHVGVDELEGGLGSSAPVFTENSMEASQ